MPAHSPFGQSLRFAALLLGLLSGSVMAQPNRNGPAAIFGPWVYTDPSGNIQGGTLQEVNAEGITWRSEPGMTSRTIAWASVEEIRRNAEPATDPASDATLGPMILLPSGDRLRGESVALLEKGLAVQSVSIGIVNLPAAQWGGTIFQPPKEPAGYLRLYQKLRKGPARPGDSVVLKNGDQIQGTVVELDGETLSLQPIGANKPAKLKRSELVAVSIDPRTASYPENNDRLWLVYLTDGSRLSGKALAGNAADGAQASLSLTTRWGAEWQVPFAKVARIRLIEPDQSPLDDRNPDAVQTVDYVGATPAPRTGMNIESGPLRVGNRYFDRGLGTQARTLMAYRLKGDEKSFSAWVGLETAAGPLGQARAVVLVDGKPVYDSGPIKAGDQPKRVQVPLNGAKLLILSSEFGEGGGVRDWVNWCEPTLK